MAEYVFDTGVDANVSRGEDAIDFGDDGQAIAEAIRTLGAMAKDELRPGVTRIFVTVRGRDGRQVYHSELTFSEDRLSYPKQ